MNTGTFYDNRVIKTSNRNIPLKYSGPYAAAYDIIRSHLKNNPDILDLGCGTGLHSKIFETLGCNITAVDISERSLQICRKNLKYPEKAKLLKADIENFLKTTSETFDIIFISGTLYYLNHEKTIARIYQLLRPNGIFICIETNGANYLLNCYRKLKARIFKHRDKTTQYGLLAPRLLEQQLRAVFKDKTDLKHYDLTTLYIPYFNNKFLSYKFLSSMDSLLLKLRFFQRFCFKFVAVGYK